MLALHYFFTVTLRERFEDKERGATAVEYGLIVALIAVAIILTVTAVGTELKSIFNDVVKALGGTPVA